MGAKRQTQGSIVIDYLRRHPSLPSLTLAKMIARDLPAEFTIETARSSIRYYRGISGDRKRAHEPAGGSLFSKNEQPNFNPWKLDSTSEDETPYRVPDDCRSIGVLSDLHIPNHRMEPIKLAISNLQERNIDALIINGDVLDNTPFTRFDIKRPTADDVRDWFDLTESILEWIRDQFPKAKIIWTEGNHDYWYRRWMYSHAWQLGEDPYFTLQERLHLNEYGIEFISQNRFVMAGKLAIVHGHHLVKGIIAPVNAARGVYLRAKRSVMIGHVHVESSHTEMDLHGDIVTCWSVGCLCTLTPDYQPMGGKACHGFAHIKIHDGGDFEVTNHRIYRGKIL